MTSQEKAVELMHRYQMEMGVTTYDILMEMAAFMTDTACEILVKMGVWRGTTCGELKDYIDKFRKAMGISGNQEEIPSNSCNPDKDLQELTWQDVKRIVEIADNESLLNHCAEECWTQEAYYTEVLRRFKEGK